MSGKPIVVPATVKDVQAAADIGNAIFLYWVRTGKFPSSIKELCKSVSGE